MKVTLVDFFKMQASELEKLQVLDLSNNDIGGNFQRYGDNFFYQLCVQLQSCRNLQRLDLSYNNLHFLGAPRVYGLLDFVLNLGKNLQLNLSNNKLFTVDDDGAMITAICNVIERCLYIKVLDLSSNGTFDIEHIQLLLSALQKHAGLRFNFENCGVDRNLFFKAAKLLQQSSTINPLSKEYKPAVFASEVTPSNGCLAPKIMS